RLRLVRLQPPGRLAAGEPAHGAGRVQVGRSGLRVRIHGERDPMSSTMNGGGRTPGTDEQEPGAAERTAQERRDLLFELFQSHKRLDRLSDPTAEPEGAQTGDAAQGDSSFDEAVFDEAVFDRPAREPEFTVVYPTGGVRIPEQVAPDAATPPDLLVAPDAMAVLAEPVAPTPTSADPTTSAPAPAEPEPPRAHPTETRKPAEPLQPTETPLSA